MTKRLAGVTVRKVSENLLEVLSSSLDCGYCPTQWG